MDMHAIEKRWEAEQNAFAKLNQSCAAKVVRWEHWDRFRWHWDPETVLESQEDSKKYPPQRTTKKQAGDSYGYDNKGNVVIVRTGPPGEPPSWWNTEFIRYSGNKITSSTFFGRQLMSVADGTLANGRVVHVDKAGNDSGERWYDIEWEDDHVSRMICGGLGKPPYLEEHYNKVGKLIREINSLEKPKPEPPKGTSLKTLEKLIQQRLMSVVPKIIANAKLKKPVYCLILAYDGEGNGAMPPGLALGLESERANWIKSKKRSELKWILWSPDEFEHCESEALSLPDDKKFDQACDWYNQLLEKKGSDKPAHDLLNRVAADLTKLNWKGKLNTTEDFIVFAVDYEGADLKKNVKASVPPKLLAKFKAAGWM